MSGLQEVARIAPNPCHDRQLKPNGFIRNGLKTDTVEGEKDLSGVGEYKVFNDLAGYYFNKVISESTYVG